MRFKPETKRNETNETAETKPQTLGVEFVDRSPGVVELELEGRGRMSYNLILTIPFDSTRKRMSVVVRAPDGNYVLYCKVCICVYDVVCVQVLFVVGVGGVSGGGCGSVDGCMMAI